MEIETKKIKTYIGNKTFEIADFKAEENKDGVLTISGYANTKHIADRYGDIPTEFNRSYVYDIVEFLKNPIMLLDHEGSIKNVAGSFVEVREDEKGLFVKGVFTKSDLPVMKHARTLIKEGHLKTFSIGGRWMYEDLENPNHLTLAKIYEISIVAVPADPNATFAPVNEKDAKVEEKKEEKPQQAKDINFKPLADKLTLFEIKQKIQKARNIGRGAK